MESNEFNMNFPELEKITNAIRQIDSFDISKTTEDELYNVFKNSFRTIPYSSAFIPKNSMLYRARLNENNKLYEFISEIGIRDKNSIIEYGRANRPNESVFYSAVNYPLAVNEITHKMITSDLYNLSATVGVWLVKSDIHVSNIIFSEKLHKIRNDIYDAYELNKSILNKNNDLHSISAYELIAQFFLDHFTNEKIVTHHDYKVSALYTSLLKNMNSNISEEYEKDKFEGINVTDQFQF